MLVSWFIQEKIPSQSESRRRIGERGLKEGEKIDFGNIKKDIGYIMNIT